LFRDQEVTEYAEANGLFFLETSAKTAQNVSELFYELGKCFHLIFSFVNGMCQSPVIDWLTVFVHCQLKDW
jgi:hypothetical protein